MYHDPFWSFVMAAGPHVDCHCRRWNRRLKTRPGFEYLYPRASSAARAHRTGDAAAQQTLCVVRVRSDRRVSFRRRELKRRRVQHSKWIHCPRWSGWSSWSGRIFLRPPAPQAPAAFAGTVGSNAHVNCEGIVRKSTHIHKVTMIKRSEIDGDTINK